MIRAPVCSVPAPTFVASRDVTDTFGDLDTFRKHGGKLLTFVGANDQLIMPRGVINYYRLMAARYGKHHTPDFQQLQTFYSLFRGPGVGHSAGGAGPQPQNLFAALVNCVEKGVAPDRILAQNATGGAVTRTRPLCPTRRPRSIKVREISADAMNYHCGGDLEQQSIVRADAITE